MSNHRTGVKKCPDDVFVVAWQRATSLAMAARVTGFGEGRYALSACSRRAGALRRMGVELKTFRGVRGVDNLRWLAKKALADVRDGEKKQ